MPVPDFQTLMLPLLRFAGDAKEHSVAEARAAIASDFKLTSDELAQMLPSGRAPLFANRLAWAKQYLSAAGLLDTSKRAHFVITSDGAELLRNPPARIDIKFLGRYPVFAAFRAKTAKASIGVVTIPEEEDIAATEPEIAAAPTVHTEIQAALLRLGAEMGYDVWVARNDRSRTFGDKQFAEFPRILSTLPVQFDEATKRTIELTSSGSRAKQSSPPSRLRVPLQYTQAFFAWRIWSQCSRTSTFLSISLRQTSAGTRSVPK